MSLSSLLRRRSIVCALGSAALLVPLTAGADQASASSSSWNYVALGDSYTASTGFDDAPDTTWVPVGCAQSHTDYPHQVAATLRAAGQLASFTDASCGGSTTENFAGPQATSAGTNAPEFDRITSATNLISIGIGGNDVGLVGLASECLAAGATLQSCKAAHVKNGVDDVTASINATEPKIEAAIRGARSRAARGARILLVNYLEGVPDNGQGCYPLIPMQPADMSWFTAKYKEVNAMLATAAAATGAQLVDTYTPTIGHNACTAPWVRFVEAEGVVSLNPPSVAAPLHPNVAGANAQSQVVYGAVIYGRK